MIYLSKIKNKKLYDASCQSAFYPSQMPILSECGGYALLSECDTDDLHIIAMEGIKAHDDIEKVLKKCLSLKLQNSEVNCHQRLYPKFGYENIDCDELLRDYMDYLYDIYEKNKWKFYGVECYLTSNFYSYLIGGKVDFFYVKDGKVVVVDLKTGYKPQSDKSFRQLMFYAVCLGEKLKMNLKEVFEMQLWTRYGVKKKVVTFKDLLLFKNDVLRKLETLKFNPGNHCAECYRFDFCKTAQKAASGFIRDIKEDPDAIKHYKNVKLIEKYLDSTKALIIKKRNEGEPVKDFEIYYTGGRKYWTNSKKKDLYKMQGMTEVKLISVREALRRGFDVKEGEHFYLHPEIKVKYTGKV